MTTIDLPSIIIKDNRSVNLTEEQKEFLSFLSGKSIEELLNEALVKENSQLLVFPEVLGKEITGKSRDKSKGKSIFTITNDTLTAHNIVGFIGIERDGKKLFISITSRFDSGEKQFFLQYLLSKVFSIYLFDLQTLAGRENIWEFLLYSVFIGMVRSAVRKGIYKEYVHRQYNDSKVKGTIDVNRFIKQDIPFLGKIAYNVREYSYDNRITQLIRHTIEHILSTEFYKILQQDYQNIKVINLIREITPNYSIRRRYNIISQNRKPVIHSYFTEYEAIRKLALQMLSYQGLAYQTEQEYKVYGILFEIAWLWEEYLNILLHPLGFKHPENLKKIGGISLFKKSDIKHIYPDFYYKKSGKVLVLDAKYKDLKKKLEKEEDDLYQIITYLHILKAEKGILIYPSNTNESYQENELKGYGGAIGKYGFKIPEYDNTNKFSDFEKKIKESEKSLCEFISKIQN